MDITFLEDQPFFPVSPLQGESNNEETNYPNSLFEPTLTTHDTVLPTRQVPWITYYRKNLRKEIAAPTDMSAPVQSSEPTQAQGTTDPDNNTICAENVCVENDIVDLTKLPVEDGKNDMTENNQVAESNAVSTTVEENEKGIIPQNPTTGEELDKPGECDTNLDLPIALRKAQDLAPGILCIASSLIIICLLSLEHLLLVLVL